jgi:hypothetical protein
MPGPKDLIEKLKALQPRKPVVQVPVGWWKDAKGVSQPPGSSADPSLRVEKPKR